MNQKAIGFIAQDIRKVVPEVVDVPKDPAGMLGIRYTELIPVLAKAIQELKQEKDGQIQELQTKEAKLEYENAAQKTELAELKAENNRLAAIVAKMDNLEKAVNALQIKVSTQPIVYDK